MRIGLFIDTFYPMVDGVINVVDSYARELLKYGEVTVFCPLVNKTPITDKPYKVVQCSSISVNGLDYSLPIPKLDPKFVKELKKSRLDVVHIHSPFTVGAIGKEYAKRKKIPLVATLHSQYKQDFDRTIKMSLPTDIAMTAIMSVFNACDVCYAVNKEIRKLYVLDYGLTAPCEIKQNASNHLPVENPEESARRINEKYGIPPEESVYLFVGRINFIKNIELIVNSLKILKDNGRKFKMLFVGAGQDEEKLKEMIEKLGLTDRVILCGKISDRETLQDIYSRAKLFLFPSLYDANSLVQIEAACQKTPTLFVYGARTAGTVTEGESGFFAQNEPKNYAEQIMKIEDDEALYQKISQGAFKDLYTTWDKVVKSVYSDYITLYLTKKGKKHLRLFKKD